jgi:hypothetical protein
MDRYRKLEVARDREHLVEASQLALSVRTSDVLEVEAYLAHDDHLLVAGQLTQRAYIRLRRLERMVPDAREDFGESMGQPDSTLAALRVDAHGYQSSHASRRRLLDHLGGVTELFEVEMRVYEDS